MVFKFDDAKQQKVSLPKIIIPDGFRIVIDTREQKPLPFASYVPTIHKKLDDGDYSIEGYENLFAIERKMLGDYTTYISTEHAKTSAKKKRFDEIIQRGGFVALILDGIDYQSLLKGNPRSKVPALTFETFRIHWEQRGFHFTAERDSRILARLVVRWAVRFYTQQQSQQQGVTKGE